MLSLALHACSLQFRQSCNETFFVFVVALLRCTASSYVHEAAVVMPQRVQAICAGRRPSSSVRGREGGALLLRLPAHPAQRHARATSLGRTDDLESAPLSTNVPSAVKACRANRSKSSFSPAWRLVFLRRQEENRDAGCRCQGRSAS